MHIREAIEEYHYAILQHSEQTQVWYQSRLNAFAEWCEDQQLSLEQIKPPYDWSVYRLPSAHS
jgi:hypothetical protein